MGSRRRGDGQNPVGTAHLPAAHMHGRGKHLLGANALHEQAHAKDIQHSIQRAYLVKVNFAYGLAVGVGFRLCDEPIDLSLIHI